MKPIINPALAAVLLLVISCTKEPQSTPNSASVQTQNNIILQAGHFIGEHFGGGIVFYLDSTGQHGLIADTVDLPRSRWWNGAYTLTKANGKQIGTGNTNTRRIIYSQGDSGFYAARNCWKYRGSGYKDWFLPSRHELNELNKQQSVVGGFAGFGVYWSSTEHDSHYVWCQDFPFGTQDVYSKGTYESWSGYTRAIRAF